MNNLYIMNEDELEIYDKLLKVEKSVLLKFSDETSGGFDIDNAKIIKRFNADIKKLRFNSYTITGKMLNMFHSYRYNPNNQICQAKDISLYYNGDLYSNYKKIAENVKDIIIIIENPNDMIVDIFDDKIKDYILMYYNDENKSFHVIKFKNKIKHQIFDRYTIMITDDYNIYQVSNDLLKSHVNITNRDYIFTQYDIWDMCYKYTKKFNLCELLKNSNIIKILGMYFDIFCLYIQSKSNDIATLIKCDFYDKNSLVQYELPYHPNQIADIFTRYSTFCIITKNSHIYSHDFSTLETLSHCDKPLILKLHKQIIQCDNHKIFKINNIHDHS